MVYQTQQFRFIYDVDKFGNESLFISLDGSRLYEPNSKLVVVIKVPSDLAQEILTLPKLAGRLKPRMWSLLYF